MTTALPVGVHRFVTLPTSFLAAQWVPDNDIQRGAVLGFLSGLEWGWHIKNPVDSRDHSQDWLFIHLGDRGDTLLAVGPGDIITWDPEFSDLGVEEPNYFAAHARFEDERDLPDLFSGPQIIIDLLETLTRL